MKLSTDVKLLPIEELKPYANNAKVHSYNVDLIANSIKEFGFKQPILIDSKKVIIAGHGRLLAAKSLNLKEVPCIIADDLTANQVKALRLADNKVAESTYDLAVLDAELNELFEAGMDMDGFGFSAEEVTGGIELDPVDPYTAKIDIPHYEMVGVKPNVEDLINTQKCHELEKEINDSQIPDEIKEFLRYAAQRHNVFDYSKIAEFYAHADAEVQALFEKSALVIIDYDNAIANGYTKLTDRLQVLRDGQD